MGTNKFPLFLLLIYVKIMVGAAMFYVFAAFVQCAGHYDTMIIPAVTCVEFFMKD